jgi:hypothetical protein
LAISWLGGQAWRGLIALGGLFGMFSTEYVGLMHPERSRAGPPSGHPERLVPGQAPSPGEQDLWSQFPDHWKVR